MSETDNKVENDQSSAVEEEQAHSGEETTHEAQGQAEKQTEQERVSTSGSEYEEFSQEDLIGLLEERDKTINNLQNQLNEIKDAHLRKAAELENYRKRVQRERAQIYETAKANALEDFLNVNDDLRRTLQAAEDLEVNDTFLDGVNLVAEKFEEVLKKHGVERIDKEMVPFNVDIHDAMMRQKPEDDSIESDMVLKVVENGYRIGDRTIRHAKVIVSE